MKLKEIFPMIGGGYAAEFDNGLRVDFFDFARLEEFGGEANVEIYWGDGRDAKTPKLSQRTIAQILNHRGTLA